MAKTDPPLSSGVFKPLGHGPSDELAEQLANLARSHRATAAQRCKRFFIEALIADPPAAQQVFESPACGLDLPLAPGR